MEDHSFFVGQEFPDVKAFRSAIKEAAIAQHFELRILKSDLVRYIAKCASEGCPWRIRAVKLPSGPTFVIRSLEGTHSCGKNAQNGHHQASVDWIVNLIDQRLRHDINYKPKDILHDIYEQYGITIPYKQAWRAKERGLQAIYGSSEEGYCLLPAYCEQIRKSNPGSVAEVFTPGADNSFQRMFISFGASLYGFINGCLPIIGLGRFHLKSKYLGTLLSATSFDAEGGLFPLAFGVVDVEDDESWLWFMSELQKALEMSSSGCISFDQIPPDFVFISDGQNAITDAVKRTFPKSSHAICMRFLCQRFGKEFKNSRLVDLLWKAAYATTIAGFREKMAEIEKISPDAANWLQKCYPPPCWALVHFEKARYGHFTSNTEEFHRWVLEARELPVIQVIWQVHSKIMQEFEGRRGESDAWVSFLVPSVERRLLEAMKCASKYQVVRSDAVEFEVMPPVDRSYIVNIGTHTCSCRDWQLLGVPCSHAVAALFSCGKDLYDFTHRYFTVEKYRAAYAGQVVPIPDKMSWETKDAVRIVVPPKFRRPPGRPEKRHRCVEDHNPEKHTVRCSQCNQTGHYKTTCKAEVVTFH